MIAALPDYLKDFTRFAYACGWRKGEVTSLRWSHVDRDGREIRLPDSKNGTGGVLGLDDDLLALIERRWQARVIEQADGTTRVADHVFHRSGRPIEVCRKGMGGSLHHGGTLQSRAGCGGKGEESPDEAVSRPTPNGGCGT